MTSDTNYPGLDQTSQIKTSTRLLLLQIPAANLGSTGHPHFLFIYLFYFLAGLGLSCGTQDLPCGTWDLSLRCAGFSLVVACWLQSAQAQ